MLADCLCCLYLGLNLRCFRFELCCLLVFDVILCCFADLVLVLKVITLIDCGFWVLVGWFDDCGCVFGLIGGLCSGLVVSTIVWRLCDVWLGW